MTVNPSQPSGLTEDDSPESGGDSRIFFAVQEFLAALENGDAPDRKQFIARFPEIAEELQQCLEGLELVHQAAPEIRGAGEKPAGAPPNVLGDYRLLHEIGRGGMGVVYEATQISLNRRVAVKVLPFAAALDRTHLQRFRNEAQAAAQLHHAGIVPVYAVGEDRGIHYYAMQLIDGEPLSQAIAQMRRVGDRPTDGVLTQGAGGELATVAHRDAAAAPNLAVPVAGAGSDSFANSLTPGMPRRAFLRVAAELIRQAAAALDYAHQIGVVHRDIKPANLLVDRHGKLWIADFGLAHVQADAGLTLTGDVLGTLAYMSPEQAAGNRPALDHRTDIYSLGVTFYELLSLRSLFPESDRHELLRRIMEDEPRPLRRIDPRIPVELEIIVGKAIAKEPPQRYRTALELAEDLERWLRDEPILARPPTLTERMRKWTRRHRSLVRLAGGFAGLGFLGLLLSTILIAAEQAKTNAAYQAELQQRMAADESFRQARRAVDAFTRLGEQELTHPSERALRRKFLETSLEYYREFIDQRRDDPAVQAELAASSGHVEQLIDQLSVLEGYAPLVLLGDRRVDDELDLSPTQRDEAKQRLAELARARREAKAGRQEQSSDKRRQQLAETLRQREREIAELLTPSQMSRLKQLAWQQQGPFAFENAEVAEALQLTAADRNRIAEIILEEMPSRRNGRGPGPRSNSRRPLAAPPPPPERRGPGGDFRPPRVRREFDGEPDPLDDSPPPPPRRNERESPGDSRMFQAARRATNRIVSMLSDEQQHVWSELVGEPFDVDLRIRPEEWSPE